MISPKPLKPGDKIAIIATARRVQEENIQSAMKEFESWGMTVVLSPLLFSRDHSYLAGTDEQRIAALQQVLDDPSLSAIVCARGGYGTTRIIDEVRFDEFKKHPKWIVGFSDVTALHLKLAALGFESIHGTMPILFGKPDSRSSIEQLHQALFGKELHLAAKNHELNRSGKGVGRAIGGNLSLLVDSLGTSHEIITDGRILVLEEIDEYFYKVDRMIVQLRRAGKFDKLAGLVVGHFTDIKDSELPFGETFQEIIRFHTRNFNYPIAFGLPTGHENPNLAWVEGRESTLEVNYEQSRFSQQVYSYSGTHRTPH